MSEFKCPDCNGDGSKLFARESHYPNGSLKSFSAGTEECPTCTGYGIVTCIPVRTGIKVKDQPVLTAKGDPIPSITGEPHGMVYLRE